MVKPTSPIICSIIQINMALLFRLSAPKTRIPCKRAIKMHVTIPAIICPLSPTPHVFPYMKLRGLILRVQNSVKIRRCKKVKHGYWENFYRTFFAIMFGFVSPLYSSENEKRFSSKGQLISKCLFVVFKSTKQQTKFLQEVLP